MKKNKKIVFRSIGVLVALSTPIVTVISCGKKINIKEFHGELYLTRKLSGLERPNSINNYKIKLISFFQDYYADSDGKENQIDISTIKNAKTFEEVEKAAKAIIKKGIYIANSNEEKSKKNTSVYFIDEEKKKHIIQLDNYYKNFNKKLIVIDPGQKAMTHSMVDNIKSSGKLFDIYSDRIKKLTKINDIIDFFEKMLNTQNYTSIDVSSIKLQGNNLDKAQKAAIDILRSGVAWTIYDIVAYEKYGIKEEKNTIVSINGVKKDFGEYVPIKDKSVFAEEPGWFIYEKYQKAKDVKIPIIITLEIYKNNLTHCFEGLRADKNDKSLNFSKIINAKDEEEALSEAIKITESQLFKKS